MRRRRRARRGNYGIRASSLPKLAAYKHQQGSFEVVASADKNKFEDAQEAEDYRNQRILDARLKPKVLASRNYASAQRQLGGLPPNPAMPQQVAKQIIRLSGYQIIRLSDYQAT